LRNFLSELKNKILVFDGSKGYLLQKFGMKGGECPELWNIEHKDVVRKIYSLYKEAGSDVIQTNIL
jgi:5-methyltetrahydrofolate--homocysteine methyltransferase